MNNRTRTYLTLFLKLTIVSLVLWWIVSKTLSHYSSREIIDFQINIFQVREGWWWFVLAAVLMPLNWFIESKKWALSLKQIKKISTKDSIKSVFSGVAIGIFTPNRVGEFAGRILMLPTPYRAQGVFSNLICSLSQLSTTLIFGTVALAIVLPEYFTGHPTILIALIQILLLLLTSFTVLLYWRSSKLLNYVFQYKWFNRLLQPFKLQTEVEISQLNRLFKLSTVRYLVFGSQFVSMLFFFQVDINSWTEVLLIPVIYLCLAIVPTLALSELGIRESISLIILGNISDNEIGILSASFALWLLNIGIPALLGCLVIVQRKITSHSR